MQYHRYKNNTGDMKHYLLPNKTFDRIEDLTLAANAYITLDYPGLDNYVPNSLAKVTESDEDVSHKVIRAREAVNEPQVEFPVVVEPAVVEPVVEQPVLVEEPVSEPVPVEEVALPVEVVAEPVTEAEPVVEQPKSKKSTKKQDK